MDNTSPDSLTPKEIDQLVTPDDMEADRKEAEARRAPGGAGAADADMAAEDDEKPNEPHRALDRGYRGSRPPQPRDQSLHSSNKRRYFQYAVSAAATCGLPDLGSRAESAVVNPRTKVRPRYPSGPHPIALHCPTRVIALAPWLPWHCRSPPAPSPPSKTRRLRKTTNFEVFFFFFNL